MSIGDDLAALFDRDLSKVLQQLQAFPDQELLWRCAPGISNSAGNLILHLDGNLREYVGRLLGGLPYQRVRDQEFTSRGVAADAMAARIEEVRQLVPTIIRQLSTEQLSAKFPEDPLGIPMSTQQYLIHLIAHLNYHLGQIDYLRRVHTEGPAIDYARLTPGS